MYRRSLALLTCGVLWGGCSFDEGGIGNTDAANSIVDAPAADAVVAIDARVIDADLINDASAPTPDGPVPDAAVPDAPVPDAPLPDAPVPDAAIPDAALIDAPITYSVVETLTVNCDGTEVTSTTTLSAAVTYHLRASGTCEVGSFAGTTYFADAEYWDFNSPKNGAAGVDMGVAIDDTVVDGTKPPDWGAYDSSHIYKIAFPGTGATITAKFYDPNYGDNNGSISVEILAPN